MFFPFGTSALKPEPIDIDVKIILIGDRPMYELLYEYEEDFRKIFKVRVEFDEEMVMRTPSCASTAAVCASFRSRKASGRSIAQPWRPCWNMASARRGAGIK
jgi:predicted ATP-dependent protease